MSTVAQPKDQQLVALQGRISDPVAVFKSDDSVNALVEFVRNEASTAIATMDVATAAGRKGIISVAHKVTRSKVMLKDVADGVLAGIKAEMTAVKDRQTNMVAALDALKEDIRKPVTDWEEAEVKRVADHQEALARIRAIGAMAPKLDREGLIKAGFDLLEIDRRDWEEFSDEALAAGRASAESLESALESLTQREAADKARLEADEKARIDRERMEAQLAEAQKLQAESQASSDALRIVNSLHQLAEWADTAEDDMEIHRKLIEAQSRSNYPHASVQLASRIAVRSLKARMDSLPKGIPEPISTATREIPIEGPTTIITTKDDKGRIIVTQVPVAPAPEPQPIQPVPPTVVLNCRDYLLDLVHHAHEIIDLGLLPEPSDSLNVREFLRSLENAEAYLNAS